MPIDRKPEFFKGAQLKVAIIGCGYVGCRWPCVSRRPATKSLDFDTDPNKVTMLNAGKSYIEHIPQTKIQQFVNSKALWSNHRLRAPKGSRRHHYLCPNPAG